MPYHFSGELLVVLTQEDRLAESREGAKRLLTQLIYSLIL